MTAPNLKNPLDYWKSIQLPKGSPANGSPGSSFSLGGAALPVDGLNWGTAPSMSSFLQAQPPVAGEFGGGYAGFMANGGGVTGPPTGGAPSMFDKLMDQKGYGGTLVGVGNIALGGFSAWMGKKNQDFLQNYYGKEQARNTQDFNNNVDSTNEALGYRQQQRIANSGIDPNSTTGQQALASYMDKWKAKGI